MSFYGGLEGGERESRAAEFEEVVRRAPKIDLHMHLDGSVSREVIESVARKHGIDLPQDLLDGYPNPGPFDARTRPEEFTRFLSAFALPLSVMRTPESLYDTTRGVVRDLRDQGVIYAEPRFAPSYVASQRHGMHELVDAALRAMKDGREETGVDTRLIVAIPREIAYEESGVDKQGNSAQDIVDVAMGFQDKGVVAIDLACSETYGPGPYVDLFRKTAGSKLRRTVHAGESGPQRVKNVRIAVQEMKADGIGHGLTLGSEVSDPLLGEIYTRRIRVERSPLSNVAMGVTNGHLDGLQRLMDADVMVSVSSDDFGIFGPTMRVAENLLYVAKKLHFGIEGIRRLTQNAARSAFIPGGERLEKIHAINRFYEQDDVAARLWRNRGAVL